MQTKKLKNYVRAVKLIAMDVDGVLTDGGIYLGTDKFEMKRFNVQDGQGITFANESGIITAIITGRQSAAVEQRGKELNIREIIQNCKEKVEGLEYLVKKYELKYENIAYIGDDVLDIKILKRVGFPACVNNAVNEVKKVSLYISQKSGGSGAVREIIEFILKLQGKYKKVLEKYICENNYI